MEGPPRVLQGWSDKLGDTLTHLELEVSPFKAPVHFTLCTLISDRGHSDVQVYLPLCWYPYSLKCLYFESYDYEERRLQQSQPFLHIFQTL